jgi:hypothetical protein
MEKNLILVNQIQNRLVLQYKLYTSLTCQLSLLLNDMDHQLVTETKSNENYKILSFLNKEIDSVLEQIKDSTARFKTIGDFTFNQRNN